MDIDQVDPTTGETEDDGVEDEYQLEDLEVVTADYILKDNKNNEFTPGKCFPPPISCLKKVKVGKPFKYLAYDKESETYVVEEIKIPEGSLFHATREEERLKLFADFLDEEESQEK